MDNHPIPQDVTSFQFRLIGEMTLKQFAYVATGIAVGWIIFALPIFLLIKLPFALLLALGGAFLAFVPVEGRPADVMLSCFIHALFSPSQYVFKQTASAPTPQEKQKTFIEHHEEKSNETKPASHTDDKKVFFQSLPSLTQAVTTQAQKAQEKEEEKAIPVSSVQIQEVQLSQKAAVVQEELTKAQEKEHDLAEQQNATAAKETHEKVGELQQQMLELEKQKEELEKRLIAMQQENRPAKQIFAPSTAPIVQETSHVRKIPAQMAKVAGAPFVPDVPNLITGIIRDARGNTLPGVLIEVKDKDDNPARAFKTNNLGQFASATPLLNGTYTLSFEDPSGKHSFDSVEITATGDIMLPIEAISVDQREKLRQELFGQAPIGA